jgi:hypothetical protein
MHRKAVVAADRSKKSTKSLSFRQAPFPEASRGNKGEAIRKPWIAPAPASARAASAGRGTAPGGPPFRGFPHTPSVEDVVPVRPIFTMNKDDAEGLEQEANLAAMPWEDFEHLVRQLFEWEFGRHGAEVRLTRTSRDRGVDAIIFDPDPLRGGFGRRPDLRAARPWQRGHAWSHLPYTSPSGGGLWPPSRLPFQLESRPIRL